MESNESMLPGFEKIQDPKEEQKWESRTNLLVFSLVLLGILPFFIWGHWFMRTPSEEHFLIGLPLTDFKSLQPVVGEEEPPRSTEFKDKSFFIILWGPWDDQSLELLRHIWLPIQNAQKNPRFKVIPIAYFARHTEPVKWYEMDLDARTRFLEQKKAEENRLGQFVQASFQNGFSFSTVWWDPVDRFRLDLMDLVMADAPNQASMKGIAFPTVIYAENGLITKVWNTNSPEDWDEMEETLKIIAAGGK